MLRVLVVDDEVAIVEALADILTAEDTTVDTASNGKQALELLRTNHYDLVLLDYMMPIMDGKETLETIRHSDSLANQRVVVMSAFSREKLNVDRLDAGLLRKPFTIDYLDAVLAPVRTKAK